ncbi:MAG: hypothetical protein U0136_21500 [Bdellovibrionota bacterium]
MISALRKVSRALVCSALFLASAARSAEAGDLTWEPSFSGFQTAEFYCQMVQTPNPPFMGMECGYRNGNVTFPPNSYNISVKIYWRKYPAPTPQQNPTPQQIAGAMCTTYQADGTPIPPVDIPGGGASGGESSSVRGVTLFELGSFLNGWSVITLVNKQSEGVFTVGGGVVKPSYGNPQNQYMTISMSPYVAAEISDLPKSMNIEVHVVELTPDQRAAFAQNPAALAALDRAMRRINDHERQHLCIFMDYFGRQLMMALNSPPNPGGQYASVGAANDAAKAAFKKSINNILKNLDAAQAKFDAMYKKASDIGIDVFPVENGDPTTQIVCAGGADLRGNMGMPTTVLDENGQSYSLDQCAARGVSLPAFIEVPGTW